MKQTKVFRLIIQEGANTRQPPESTCQNEMEEGAARPPKQPDQSRENQAYKRRSYKGP